MLAKIYIKIRKIFSKHKMFGNTSMMDFGGGPGGPMITGRWMNKHNGTHINVRDSIIDGDDMCIMTDRGTLDFATFSRDYIQVSDEMYDDAGNVINNVPVSSSEVVPSTSAPTVQNALNTPFVPYNETEAYVQTTTPAPQVNETEHMLSKIFDKIETKPQINLQIEWTGFPANELKMLAEYFDVTAEDIARYIGKHYVDDTAINGAIEEFLNNKI